ncbi:MAG TPA: hypothetical protein VMT46_00835 [Anaerolineaceae bacterium]|nr:hypothetical protein [Anaerolineaceae bacterium]
MSENFYTNPPEDSGMKPADPQAETVSGAQEMNSEGAPVTPAGAKTAGTTASARLASDTLKDALKSVENVGQVLGQALQGRGNVVMVRVNDETLKHLDMLVEAEVTRSRSEGAALLINEGIKANQVLFSQITEIANQISELRAKLRESVKAQK